MLIKKSRRSQSINQAFAELSLIRQRSRVVLLDGLATIVLEENLPIPNWISNNVPETGVKFHDRICEQALIDLVHSSAVPLTKAVLLQGLVSVAKVNAKWLVPRITGEFKRYKHELASLRQQRLFSAMIAGN
ncbi:MAG: hypothetical protein ACXADA_15600 [Candidatus Hodarchaeales archaeon]